MNARHRKSPRSYAQVMPDEAPVYELAEAVRWLPEPNRRALFAHEVGHVLDPEGTEDQADRAANAALGITIDYDRRWPGKGLQVEAGMRQNRVTATCESGLTQWEDGFCPPRGELEGQPNSKWLSGCPRELLLAVGQELGDLDVKALAKEQSCSAASVRKLLKELEAIGAVQSYQPMAGLDKKGGRAYRLTSAGMDMVDWLAFRETGAGAVLDTSFDFGALAPPAPPADRKDPWDWKGGKRDLGEITVEVERSEDYDTQPALLRAYSSTYPEDPLGGLELWYSARAAHEDRAFGKLGPDDYAIVGTMRVSPQFRQAGVATALLERAAREAASHDKPLASPDNRTPEEAAWWAKQVKKKRASKIRHRSRKHPEASRYLLKYPPPESLANPHERYSESHEPPSWWAPGGWELVPPPGSPTPREIENIARTEYARLLTPEQQERVARRVSGGHAVFVWPASPAGRAQLAQKISTEIRREWEAERLASISPSCQVKRHARCEGKATGSCRCWCHRPADVDDFGPLTNPGDHHADDPNIGRQWGSERGVRTVLDRGTTPSGVDAYAVGSEGTNTIELIPALQLERVILVETERAKHLAASESRKAEETSAAAAHREAETAPHFDRFAVGMKPAAREKARQALAKQIVYKGRPARRWEVVQEILADGGVVGEREGVVALIRPSGSYLLGKALGSKVATDYATFLHENRLATQPLDNPRDAGRDVVLEHIGMITDGWYSPSDFARVWPKLVADAGTEVEHYGDLEEIDIRALYDQAENASRKQIQEYLAEFNERANENPRANGWDDDDGWESLETSVGGGWVVRSPVGGERRWRAWRADELHKAKRFKTREEAVAYCQARSARGQNLSDARAFLHLALAHAPPPSRVPPPAPGLRGWTTGGGFVCGVCAGRIMGRGVNLPGPAEPVWSDQGAAPEACVTCGRVNPPQAFGERSFRGAVAAAKRLLAAGPSSPVALRMFERAVQRCADQTGVDPSDIAAGAMSEAQRSGR